MPNLVSNFFTITVAGSTTPQNSAGVWNLVAVPATVTPFQGSKHVWMGWHPIKKRVYTWGGDYGANMPGGANAYTFDGGIGTDVMPAGGSSFITNNPAGSITYVEGRATGAGATSYRNDQYSIDPYAPSPAFRLEHPYLPRNLGGSPESRPPCDCQQALVWDPVRSKFWGIATHIRPGSDGINDGTYNGMYNWDVWAGGTWNLPNRAEPPGTWSWIPSANGGAGTWTLETTNALVCEDGFAVPTYQGGRLFTQHFDYPDSTDQNGRLGMWMYAPNQDIFVTVSGRQAGTFADSYLFIYKPATKTYEWRRIFTQGTRGWNYIDAATSPIAVVGDWAYVIGTANQSGTRRSVMLSVNLAQAMSTANQMTLADSTNNWQVYILPWSLSPTSGTDPNSGIFYSDPAGVWEGLGRAWAKWQESCGVVAADNKVVLACSLNGLIDAVQGQKFHIFDPTTQQFYAQSASPDNVFANAWCPLPDTGEIFMGMTTSSYGVPGNRMWRVKVAQLGSTPILTPTYNMATEVIEPNGAHDSPLAWTTAFLRNDGQIISWGLGNHNPNQTNSMRIMDPVTSPGSMTAYLEFPWTQEASPPFWFHEQAGQTGPIAGVNGYNRYVSCYDNHPQIYLPSENKSLWIYHGVFNHNTHLWESGDRSPNTQDWKTYVDSGTTGFDVAGYYNPTVLYCAALDRGYFFSSSSGGGGGDHVLKVLERKPGGPQTWRIRYVTIANPNLTVTGRNGGVVIGTTAYLCVPRKNLSDPNEGPLSFCDFFTINLQTETFGTFIGTVDTTGWSYPQLVYDSYRNNLVLIGVGVKLYSLTTNGPWIDVTPAGWRGYYKVTGVYHPTLDAIFFRGQDKPTLDGGGGGPLAIHFQWHRLKFTAGTVPSLPSYSTSFATVQNPLSEGGIWTNGGTTGLAWNNVQVPSAGLACAVSAASGFNDSIAHLNNWTGGNNYEITATLHKGSVGSIGYEAELHGRFITTANNARGYEVLFNAQNGIQIIRWNGPVGSFTDTNPTIDSAFTLSEGSTCSARFTGTLIEAFVNGVRVAHVNESTWADGNPGMGFDKPSGADPVQFGWKTWSVISI